MSTNLMMVGIVRHISLGIRVKCVNRITGSKHYLQLDKAWKQIVQSNNQAVAWKEQIKKLGGVV